MRGVAALVSFLACVLLGVASASAATNGPMLSATFDSSNNSQDVYFEAPNGSLQEDAWTPSTGFLGPRAITGPGALASAPGVTFDSVNDSQDVYFEAPDGSLLEDAWTPSTGFSGPRAITAAGTLGLPPARPLSTPGTTTLTPPAPPPHPRPHPRGRPLRVKIVLSWRWSGRRTQLVGVAFGRLPRHAELTISCRGRGCPRRPVSALANRFGHRLTIRQGPIYRAAGRLLISLSAPHYTTEVAEVSIRRGRIPAARLLS